MVGAKGLSGQSTKKNFFCGFPNKGSKTIFKSNADFAKKIVTGALLNLPRIYKLLLLSSYIIGAKFERSLIV